MKERLEADASKGVGLATHCSGAGVAEDDSVALKHTGLLDTYLHTKTLNNDATFLSVAITTGKLTRTATKCPIFQRIWAAWKGTPGGEEAGHIYTDLEDEKRREQAILMGGGSRGRKRLGLVEFKLLMGREFQGVQGLHLRW